MGSVVGGISRKAGPRRRKRRRSRSVRRIPGKMTLRDAQPIEKLFFRRYSIGYLTRGTMKSYEPACGRGQYDINCTE